MMKLFTCKDVSKLASEAMDRKLSLRERIGMKLHLWVCAACQRYVKHLRFLRRAAGRAGEELPQTALDSDAKDRMKKALRGQGKSDA